MDSPLRRAVPEDIELLTSLMREFHAESGHRLDEASARSVLRRLCTDASLGDVWLVLEAGEPVGYAALSFGFSLEFFGREAFLADLFIRPAHRGRGLGTRTLAAIEAQCRSHGVLALHVEVGDTNVPARRLYRRHGLRSTGRQLLTRRFDD